MSNLNKIIKKDIETLLETKGFEDIEVAFGVRHKSDNLSDAEKNQFGPMGQLKTTDGGSFKNPAINGMKVTDASKKEAGSEAQAYYREVAKKVKDFQKPDDGQTIAGPRVPTNTGDDNERLENTGYDIGVSGMEVVADLAAEKGGSEETKKIYKDRVAKLQGDKSNYTPMSKNAKETNDLKYKKDARNTRPVKSQTSKQMEENVFKVNGKIISEQQVLKLVDKLPTKIKIDETVFSVTDGETTYKLIWEGDSKTGEAVITNKNNKTQVNEDIQKMKHLWNFDSKESLSTKKNIKEDGEDAFRRIFKKLKENK
jgi:hypothetical protein